MPHHPDLAERERHENADDVELDQCGDLGIECDDERDGRQREEHDPVRESQPAAAGEQLAGKVAILGQDGAEYRKAIERGVGRQDEDQRGDAGDQIQAERKISEDRVRELGHQRLLPVVGGRTDELFGGPFGDFDAGFHRQHDHAHEQHDRDSAQQGQGCRGIARLGFAKCRNAVADRFDPGQRRAAGRKRPGHQEHQREAHDVAVLGTQFESGRLRPDVMTHPDLDETPRQHAEHADHEGVGGDGEEGAGFSDAAEIGRRQQHDRGDCERHLMLGDERNGRADVGHRRGHRHRHRQGVVDHQCAGHRQPGGGSEIGGGDLVVPAAGGVGVHVLAVGGHHHHHHQRHRKADPGCHHQRGQARDRQHQEDLLGRVRHRGHGIGGEHRQGDALGEQRVAQLVAAERLAQEQPAHAHRNLGHESQE